MSWKKGNHLIAAGVVIAVLLGATPVIAKAERPTDSPRIVIASWSASFWKGLIAWWASVGITATDGVVSARDRQIEAAPWVEPNGGSRLNEGPGYDPNGVAKLDEGPGFDPDGHH